MHNVKKASFRGEDGSYCVSVVSYIKQLKVYIHCVFRLKLVA